MDPLAARSFDCAPAVDASTATSPVSHGARRTAAMRVDYPRVREQGTGSGNREPSRISRGGSVPRVCQVPSPSSLVPQFNYHPPALHDPPDAVDHDADV